MIKFHRIAAGHYATDDGKWAVVSDGYSPSQSIGADNTGYEGFTGGEWAAVYDPQGRLRESHNAGENLDWFPTKREAVAFAVKEADRRV